MAKKQILDMTQGNPLPILVRFAIPLILGSLFQQLYSFVDTAIVGRCIGAEALTAVGVTGSLNFLVLGFTMGSAMGFCIPISQAVGAGDTEEVSRNFWNGLYLSIGIGLVISIGVSFFTRPLLAMMKTPANLLDMAVQYLTIIFVGQITTVLYNYFAGVLRAFGDSKRPFWFLIISSCINVVLDLLLILVIPMGVAGAALATVISQGISVTLCIWWLTKKMNVIRRCSDAGERLTAVSAARMKKICVVGMPLGLEYSVCTIGNVVLQSSINSLGSVVAAAHVCGEKIRAIATLPIESLGTAVATYAGQNYGAKRIDRIKDGIKAGLTIVAVYCVAAWAALLVLKAPLVSLLLGETASAEAQASIEYLSIISTLFLFHGSLMIFRNTVQGMGYSASTLASAVMEIIGRSAAGLLAVHYGSFFLICVSAPMAWTLACICCIGLCMYYIPKADREFAGITK